MNSKLAYNLYTAVERNGETASYYFYTQSSGKNEARSVENVLPYKMNNDLGEVLSLIRQKDLQIEDGK